MIAVVGDFDPGNPTHVATSAALAALGPAGSFEWVLTDEVEARWAEVSGAGGYFVAPASPYRDMDAVLKVIEHARETGVPLVGT